MSKKKKHVKAPLTYDPGKGRPKEHLAYLNYQEMQALKRLNGENVERGPRGLPSFASTGPSSSLSAPARTAPSTASSTPRGNTGSYPSRGTVTSTPKAPANYSSSISGSKGGGASTQRPGAGGNSGTVSRSTVSSAQNKNTAARNTSLSGIGGSKSSSSNISGGRTGFSGAGTNTRDAVARQVAASRDATKIARESPAFRGDAVKGGVKSINVGPMGKEVPIGGKVKGAISEVAKAEKTTVSGPYEKMNLRGPTGPAGEPRILPSAYGTQYQNAQIARYASQRFDKYGQDRVAQSFKEIGGALPGEADIFRQKNPNAMNDLARVSLNQVLGGFSPEQATYALDTTGLDPNRNTKPYSFPSPYSIGATKNWDNKELARAYDQLAAIAMRDALMGRGISKEAKYATNFGAKGAKMDPGLRKIGSPVNDTQFYRDPNWRNLVQRRQDEANKILSSPGSRPPSQVATRQSGMPPHAGTQEHILAVENLMSDAGVRKATPGFRPSPAQSVVMTDPRAGIPPAPNRPNVAANAASLAGKVTSLTRGLFGNQTPASAPIGPDPFMAAGKRPEAYNPPAQTAKSYDPLSSVKTPAQTTGKVALEPMETPKMPGAPKGTTTKTDVYTVKKGSIPADAEKTISDVLQNPDKITQLAKEQKWGNQDPKRLAEIKRDINALKELGVKVENGKITIPKAAAQKAQATLNKIATSYSPTFGKMAPGYGDTFSEGLGSISKKSTTTTTKPPSAEQMSRYDMNMADYRDAMRGLAMSPSLQKPGDVYAGSVPTNRQIAMSDAGVRKSMPGAGAISVPRGAVGPDPFMVAGTPAARGIAALPTGNPAGPFGAPTPNSNLPVRMAGNPSGPFGAPAPNSNLPAPIGPDPSMVANPRAEAYAKPPIPRLNPLNDPSKFIQVRTLHGTKPEVLSRLVALQEQIGEPIRVTSGYRDPGLNKKVGGAKGSQHLQANAVDIEIQNPTPDRVANAIRLASAQGFTGIGAYASGRLHIDLGSTRVWSNGNNGSNIGKLPAQVQMALADHTSGRIPKNSGTMTADPTKPGTQRLYVQESIAPWKAGTYDTPYPVDANGVPIQNVSPEDRAKQDARRRGVPYTPTPEEKKAIAAGTILTRVIGSKIPGLSTVINTKAKMTDFYSRPSWEQAYIAQRAKDWALARGDVKASPSEVAAAKQRIATHTVPNGTATGSGGTKTASGSSGIGESRGSSSLNIYNQIASEIDSGAVSAPGSGGNSGGESPAALNSSRPYAYYEWDLGVNIPSPGDAKYNEFQGYLAERAAAQAAMYT